MSKRRAAWLVLPIVALLPAGSAVADTSSAEASAAHVEQGENSASVGHTSADSGSGEYRAESFAVNGEPAHERSGGSATAGSQSEGAAFDTEAEGGEQLPVKLALMPWSADGVAGESTAALLVLQITDGEGGVPVELAVLQSQSRASGSSSGAHSDGVLLRLGDGQVEAHILHAEADNEGGATYIVGIGDNHILSQEQAGDSCTLSIPDVADLSCLIVRQEGPEVLAAVAEASLGGGQLGADLFRAMANGGQIVAPPLPAPGVPAPDAEVLGASQLPRTGDATAARILAALALAAVGLVGYALSREETPASVTSLR